MKRVTGIILGAALAASVIWFAVAAMPQFAPYNFRDEGLEQAVRRGIQKPDGIIDAFTVSLITELYIDGDDTVASLEDLRGFTGLSRLHVEDTAISDISPLLGLSGLESLTLKNCALGEVGRLNELAGLTELDLSGNPIPFPAVNITALRELRLNSCGIEDLSGLSELPNLESLELDHNKISGLEPLSGLGRLEYLSIIDNYVWDFGAVDKVETVVGR